MVVVVVNQVIVYRTERIVTAAGFSMYMSNNPVQSSPAPCGALLPKSGNPFSCSQTLKRGVGGRGEQEIREPHFDGRAPHGFAVDRWTGAGLDHVHKTAENRLLPQSSRVGINLVLTPPLPNPRLPPRPSEADWLVGRALL